MAARSTMYRQARQAEWNAKLALRTARDFRDARHDRETASSFVRVARNFARQARRIRAALRSPNRVEG